MAKDPETRAHQEWLGLLQPVGLVVSPPALVKAQAVVQRNAAELQKRLRGVLQHDERGRARLPRFEVLAREILGWEAGDLVRGDGLPNGLEVALPEHEEVLRPTYAVPDADKGGAWVMLVQELPELEDVAAFDDAPPRGKRRWHASPQIRMERLLQDTGVVLGLLCTPAAVRVVVAPAGESSGHMTFPVDAMAEVPGRTILAALHMLLCSERMFTLPPARRLPAIVAESRKYQNVVSTQLAEQVLRALGELLRGFQAADDATGGTLLGNVVREDPQHVYGGLITVLMRLVFLLYAEEREMLPGHSVYLGHYSVGGLFEKLRADAGLYPDTMDQRYGAWARLLSLFRLVFEGGGHGEMWLPARRGQLFHPDEYPFLEGRPPGGAKSRLPHQPFDPPRVSDGVVYRVLEDLLMLDGERLSYRSLDVEQIGSVYEAVMGFEVTRARGPSIGVRPHHVVVDLGEVVKAKGKARVALLEDAGCKLGKTVQEELKAARSLEDLVAAIGKKVSPQTPRVLPPGSLFLQPTEERRRSGSHYTPRSLTEPIVRTTLQPVLEALGEHPTAEQILGLKVCDPAMGSGAFLVEACRHLASRVVEAWERHGAAPPIATDEGLLLHARRLVAQRCLYGVDKNPFAVGLAKLSLWLVTLAKDHPFTFLDHALKSGDSLVGLTRRQIAAFHWKDDPDLDLPLLRWMAEQIGQATTARVRLAEVDDDARKRAHLTEAEAALEDARSTGNLVIAAFFSGETDKARERTRSISESKRREGRAVQPEGEHSRTGPASRTGPRPFHWELEFPEIFDRSNPGFDAFIGNPPFLSGRRISEVQGSTYNDWLSELNPGTSGGTDLAGHFYRKAFALLRSGGTFGLIATNAISRGDTRIGGLKWIATHGGHIYDATRRKTWPGKAAVVVSIVHVIKHRHSTPVILNNKQVPLITSYLFHSGGDDEPRKLKANKNLCFQGHNVLGLGFTFDDKKAGAHPLAVMRDLVAKNSKNAQRILPYIGGDEVKKSPTHAHHRFVISFEEMTEDEARCWPDLYALLERSVKPERSTKDARKYPRMVNEWWKFWNFREDLEARMKGLDRILVVPLVTSEIVFAFLPTPVICSHKLGVLPFASYSPFACLQSRAHDTWSRFFTSPRGDSLNYSPTDCLETFPMPSDWLERTSLEEAGRAYEQHRAELMRTHGEGLTATYNRFHDPDETSPGITRLRELHDAMDRAMLDAYGWKEIRLRCDFLLEHEEDQDDEGGSRRRKPWRYRWVDEVQEEVLARLLDLNQKRAAQERGKGLASEKRSGKQAPAAAEPASTRTKATKKPAGSRASAKERTAADDDGEWKTTKKRAKKRPQAENLDLLPPDDPVE